MLTIFLDILTNPGFVNFISTFGLASVITLFFILYREPKRESFWQKKYEDLSKSYESLNSSYKNLARDLNQVWERQYKQIEEQYKLLDKEYEELNRSYQKLENDLQPETRRITESQAKQLAELGFDRDLYKLYYYACRVVDNLEVIDMQSYIQTVIQDTNATWSLFISPFPLTPRIGDLHETYHNQGCKLKAELNSLLNDEESAPQIKKEKILRKLTQHKLDLQQEFNDLLRKLENGKEVRGFQDVNV